MNDEDARRITKKASDHTIKKWLNQDLGDNATTIPHQEMEISSDVDLTVDEAHHHHKFMEGRPTKISEKKPRDPTAPKSMKIPDIPAKIGSYPVYDFLGRGGMGNGFTND